MDTKLQLKLQGYFDGELSEHEARRIGDLLSKDAGARDLLLELRQTRDAIRGFEAEIKVPESREYYWSKIAREIERSTMERAPVPTESFTRKLLRAWFPLGALGLAIAAAGIWGALHKSPGKPEVEVALADSAAFTYRDYSAGTTLIWLSYPVEGEFGNGDSDETLD